MLVCLKMAECEIVPKVREFVMLVKQCGNILQISGFYVNMRLINEIFSYIKERIAWLLKHFKKLHMDVIFHPSSNLTVSPKGLIHMIWGLMHR